MCAARIAFVSLFVFSAGVSAAAEPEKAEKFFQEAQSRLSRYDSSGALILLDQALETDSKDYPSLLLRGRLYLRAGDGKKALRDFKKALTSKDRQIRLKGYLGLADTYRLIFKKNYPAEQNCRKALAIDPHSPEALYCKAQIGFSYGMTDGFNMAGQALAQLLCIDPGYRDSYYLWREKIKDQSEEEIRRVDECLISFLEEHPDSAAWWVDIARDRYRLGEIEKALETLEQVEINDTCFRSPEKLLIEARCRLELGDTMVFQTCYERAIELAEKTGDFGSLFNEVQTIFSSVDFQKWAELGSDKSVRAIFLRQFWAALDPDPLAPWNTRLVEHYRRLRHAEKHYAMTHPHSLYQSSRNYNLQVSYRTDHYYYDPGILYDRSRHLPLDPRGLLYVRFGPPELIRKDRFEQRTNNPVEAWYYRGTPFIFEKISGAGDYIFRPGEGGVYGDMLKAMEIQRYSETSLIDAEWYFSAKFLSADRQGVEWEFYQDEELAESAVPQAAVAVFDTTGIEITREESRVYKVSSGQGNLWLAVHRATVAPGKYRYGVRVKTPGRRWIGRGSMEIRPFDLEHIEFSGIILGPLPDPDLPAYVRNGVRLMPRPSCMFRRGELINVYLELYGLKTGPDGERAYKEWIDVIRLEAGESKIKKYVGKFIHMIGFGGEKPATSLTFSFDRTAKTSAGPAVEVFTMDTSPLAAGSYRLLIQARDNVSAYWDSEEVFFDIVD